MGIVGNRIRECRLANHMTQDDVARHLGIGKQAVYKYEIGTVTNIPLENLERMAALFHTTPGYLAGWSNIPETVSSAPLSSDEDYLVSTYRSLSLQGKQLMMDRAAELTVLYGKKSDSSEKSG